MAEVVIMGEILAEIMRTEEDIEFYEPGLFKGPYPSGAPAIFIDTAARLGCETAIIGGVGADDFGKCILDRLSRDGVDVSRVIKSNQTSTGVAFVMYRSDSSRKFIYHLGNTPAVEARMPDINGLGRVKYFHIMGCSLMADKRFAAEILKTMHALVAAGAKVSFDPNIRKELLNDASVYQVVEQVMKETNVFLPGIKELQMVSGEHDIEAAVRKCFENSRLEVLALKDGSRGSTIYTRDSVTKIASYPVKQLDATGAGDCFDGAFIAGLVQQKGIREAAEMAAAAGALNAAAFGPMEGDISPARIQQIRAGRMKKV